MMPGPLQFYFWYKRFGFLRHGIHHHRWKSALGPIHYWQGGPQNPAGDVILIHGLGGSTLQDFANLPPALVDQRRVWTLDLPGFGFSCDVPVEQTISNHVEILHDFIVAHGIEKPVLIGNSMGGWVTLSFCLKYPDVAPKIILLAPAGIEFEPPPPEIFLPESPADMDRLLEYLIYHPPRINDWFRRDWFGVMARRRPAIQAMIQKMLTRTEVLSPGQIARVEQPTLIIFGEEDKIIPANTGRRLHEWLPRSELILYPQCGHLVQATHFARTLADILRFLE